MRWGPALLVLLLVAPARADATGAVLAKADSELARGKSVNAERTLLAGLKRAPAATSLLLRYAELTVPCARDASSQKAGELLRRIARAEEVPSDASTVPDSEQLRKLALHAAFAEALVARFDASMERLRGAIQRQDPESAQCARGIAALAIDQLAIAGEALSVAHEVMPQDAELAGELARVQLARGRTDLALPLFAERFAISNADLSARRDLAYALAADGRPDEALSLLVPARDACAQDAGCALTAARIAVEANRFDEATRYLRAREDLDSLFALADVQTRAGKLSEARATYERILQAHPESVRAKQALSGL